MGRALLGVALLSALAAAGCGAQSILFGAEGGYLFTAYDVVAVPGEEVLVRARLQGGDFLRDQPGHAVRFDKDGLFYKAAETGGNGFAIVTFTPDTPGDYLFRAELAPSGFSDEPPEPVQAIVRCRTPDTPVCIVDLDKTLVASGFHLVLVGDPQPMPGSVDVMKRIDKDYTVVYLTHRPDLFGVKSKGWLRQQGYPLGPLLLSDIGGFIQGSGAFKSNVLKDLRARFTGNAVGIGDKISDAQAYFDNGLRSFLIVQPDEAAGAASLAKLADSLDTLDDQVQVVTGWDQVEKALYGSDTYPRSKLQGELRKRASALEAQEKAQAD